MVYILHLRQLYRFVPVCVCSTTQLQFNMFYILQLKQLHKFVPECLKQLYRFVPVCVCPTVQLKFNMVYTLHLNQLYTFVPVCLCSTAWLAAGQRQLPPLQGGTQTLRWWGHPSQDAGQADDSIRQRARDDCVENARGDEDGVVYHVNVDWLWRRTCGKHSVFVDGAGFRCETGGETKKQWYSKTVWSYEIICAVVLK